MMLELELSKYQQTSEFTSQRVPTLKKRSDFLRLRSGKRYSTKSLVLEAKSQDEICEKETTRVGYTVTKRVGNAVVRNRIKRRLRNVVAQVFPLKSMPRHDYVIIGKHAALTRNFASIQKDLEQALDHVHQNKAKGSSKFTKSGDAADNIPTKTKDTQQD